MFGERLAEIRRENEDTQLDLAEKINVSVQSLRNWEQGRNYPPCDKLLLICELYSTSADYLLGLSNDGPSIEAHCRKSHLTKDELAALQDYEKYLLWKRKTTSR